MSTTKGKFAIWLLSGLIGLCPVAGQAQTVVKYVHTDALGSVVSTTDAARNVMERREYEPYGHQLTPAIQNGPGYTGHVQDAATGLTYMQQRYYDPTLGRFLSVDPVTAYEKPLTNFNRYAYAFNNPYKFTDPDGRDGSNFYTNKQQQMQISSYEGAGTVADFLPVIGDIKAFFDFARTPTVAGGVAAIVGLAGPLGDAAATVIKGADRAISMEKAIDAGIDHVGQSADVVMTKGGNVQFTSTTTDAAGNSVTKNARFDVNPSNGHVQKQGPHLNLETQVNGKKVGVDPHTPIKPETIRRGDHE